MSNFIKNKDETNLVLHKIKNSELIEELKPDFYQVKDIGGMFKTILSFDPVIQKDGLIKFSTGKVAEVIDKVNEFLDVSVIDKYKTLQISHKLGIILHGPPGTGKTSSASLIIETLIKEKNAICLDVTGLKIGFIRDVVSEIKSIQENPIVLFMDEIDASIDYEENAYLPFLDGADSFNNLILIGCTNYLDKIPDRIKNRKSRIKHLIEIKSFPVEVYKEYISNKLKTHISDEDLVKFAYLAEEHSLTIDNLKHSVIDHFIEGKSIEKAIKDTILI